MKFYRGFYPQKKSALNKARFVFVVSIFCLSLSNSPTIFAGEFVVESNKQIRYTNLNQEEQSLLDQTAADELGALFVVELLDSEKQSAGKVWGTVSFENEELTFTPRFPLDLDRDYRVSFFNQANKHSSNVEHNFALAGEVRLPNTEVSAIYPSSNELPENLFKFYIHFSQAMSRGQAYQHIKLLDEDDKPVPLPFLQLDQELWDPSGQRFTLLFDPGRTKKGIKPNRDMGLPLQVGKQFTLVIDENWEDAGGLPLKKGMTKTFTVVEQDNTQPSIEAWKVTPPKINSLKALKIEFEEPLDQAQLENALWVEDDNGNIVDGDIEIKDELIWLFRPKQIWKKGQYTIVARSYLEDRAANSLGRAFEVIRMNEDQKIPESYRLEFSVTD